MCDLKYVRFGPIPEDLLHEFLTMSHLKISTIRFDGASEFGKSTSFISYCTQHDIVREPLASYTHIQNARSLDSYWSDANGLSVWEKLDSLQEYLTTPNFWIYSFRTKKVMMLSDPKHWDHILPFMQSGDVPHRIALTDADIRAMHVADDHEDGDVSIDVVTTRSQAVSKLRTSGELPAPSATSNSGEKVQELSVSTRLGNMIDDMVRGAQQVTSSKPMLQDYNKFKHGKEVSQEDEIQYLKQHLLEQGLVHHKHVMQMPHDFLDPDPT